MFAVIDKKGDIYASGDSSGEALMNAVRLFCPDRRRKIQRAAWDSMKEQGFKLEQIVPFPFPFRTQCSARGSHE